MAKKKLSFEESLSKLEALAEQIEQGKIGLEESIAGFEARHGESGHPNTDFPCPVAPA